ncbi:MAG: hypothetical protein AB8B84_15715 [Granulosicoccus sp.]
MNNRCLTDKKNTEHCATISKLSIRLLLVACAQVIFAPAQAQSCAFLCQTNINYQHPTSILQFSNSFLKDVENSAHTEYTSRHRFDIVLTQDDSTFTIFDHLGNEHIFVKSEADILLSPTRSGSFFFEGNIGHWTDNSGNHYQFRGSYLTHYTAASLQTLTMQYANRRLSSITDENGDSVTLLYDDDGLSGITTPTDEFIDMTGHECFLEADNSQACDTDDNPIPGFNNLPNSAGATHIDIRPASCESYFIEYFGTQRGTEVENALARATPYSSLTPTIRSYPIIDFIDGNNLIVVRSRDIANPSFNDPENPNALLYRLLRDGREIQTRFITPLTENGQVSTTEEGQTTTIQLGANPPNITLQLVIRHHIASPAHWAQIARARAELLSKYGVVLEVVIIP